MEANHQEVLKKIADLDEKESRSKETRKISL
jgi:hypothetical protein